MRDRTLLCCPFFNYIFEVVKYLNLSFHVLPVFMEGQVCVARLTLNENILTDSAPTGICEVKACFFI